MLIATAGHVDHGKTALIRALTGVDTDRLPEEKRRGLSIDLGFAYQDLGDGAMLGFIDVPGHERFVGNMLAGVAAIDFALLVVAADDGVMPQTREHLAILDLLGIEHGAVALTKVDAVSQERIEQVEHDVRALIASSALATARMFEVSALAGTGIGELENHLIETSRRLSAPAVQGNFRLAVDRRFTVAGAGVVVTGTVFSGEVHVGDQVRLLPAGLEARVRGLHAQSRESERGCAGQRCALNLGGPNLSLDRVSRGDWVTASRVDWTTRRFDARAQVLESETRGLAHWTPVHAHVGAANIPARVAVLEGRRIQPGEEGLVQIVLDRETNAMHGDRFILRDQSARRTLGGGMIIDPQPPVRGRARAQRLDWLRNMETRPVESALSTLIGTTAQGVDLDHFVAARNLTPQEAEHLFRQMDMVQVTGQRSRLAFAPKRWDELTERVRRTLAAWHEEHPDRVGPGEAVLASAIVDSVPRDVARFAVQALVADGSVVRDGLSVRLPDHQPRLPPEDVELWRRVSAQLAPDARQPPVVSDLAAKLGVAKPALSEFLDRAAARGQLVRVTDNRYLHPRSVASLAAIAETLAGESDDQSFDAKTYRDRARIGRNFTIQLLEYFDRLGLTRRIGDARRMARSSKELFA